MRSQNPGRLSFARKFFLAAAVLALGGAALVWKWPAVTAPEASPGLVSPTAAAATVPVTPAPAVSALAVAAPASAAVALPPDPSAATLQIAGRQIAVRANSRGEFSRVLVAPSALIAVEVGFPGAMSGETLPMQNEDGGTFASGVSEGQTIVGDDGRARFEFRTAPHDGLNRVTLRRGGESRVLEFWVGPEAPVLVRR